MTNNYRFTILRALKAHYEAQIEYHKVNINIMLDNVVAVAEHPDVMNMVDEAIVKLSEYDEKLQTLNKYFTSVEATSLNITTQ
jgi:hypothetical protein